MKKMLLKCLAVAGLVFATSSVFAAEPTFQVHIESTPAAISAHNAIVANSKSTGLKANFGGLQSDIIAINFTSAPVTVVIHDDFSNTDIALNIPSRSSGRYGSIHFFPYRTVTVLNPNGAVAWQSNSVESFDTIAVYLSDNKYVVYDTKNPPPV
jgi:hypothetical protein